MNVLPHFGHECEIKDNCGIFASVEAYEEILIAE